VTRYRTIVADPPWHYERMVGRTIGGGEGWQARGLPYGSMTLDEIRALPVATMADADARLFLWTTNRYLCDAFSVIAAWGFRYQQALAWHKTNASPYPGAVAVLDLEFLLVGQRGTPGRLKPARSSLISKAISRHSAKPEAFLDLVETVSPGPYLEMFARRDRLGWDTWGNESLGTAELPEAAA
jgi:N6-adenosine-specific RNA methylase IME4